MEMYFVEFLLLIALFLTCVYASVTDIKLGIIPNKLLVLSGFSCAFLNLIYYTFFAEEYFLTFIINFIILVILSVAMYGFNLWAAGDSKLLFVVVLAIPARLYDTNVGIAPAIFIIVFTFAILIQNMNNLFCVVQINPIFNLIQQHRTWVHFADCQKG